jgi:O-antigen ligase
MARIGPARPGSTDVVIHRGRLYWSGREYAAHPSTRPGAGRLDTLRNTIVLTTVWLYLLFNWGFMQLRVPPVSGGGLPVGEIVLFLALITINYTGVLGRLSRTVSLVPLAIWWAFGVGRAMFGFMENGLWALRDAAHVLESLFLLIGFVFAGDPRSLERFFDWLPKMLVIAVLYGMLYPFREQIWSLSPTIMSGAGYEAPILGSMATTAYLMIMAAVYLILWRGNTVWANLIAVLIIGYAMAIFQARTLYLTLIAVFGFLIAYRRSAIGNIGVVVYLFGLCLALVALVGLQFQGRLGASFSFDFLVHHFLAIFGVSSQEYEGVASAAAGIDQRLEWWQHIYEQMLADPFSLLLGLGYGLPLTDFHGSTGAVVREPHNSYVTILARTGIIGAICWFAIMANLIGRWHQTFMHCREIGWRLGENRLMILMVFFLSIWVLAIGEDGFEKPYNIIPFYFFWGIVLRMSLLLEGGEIGPEAEDAFRDPEGRYRAP